MDFGKFKRVKIEGNIEEQKNYWFEKIQQVYGIDLSDLKDLNISKISGELEKRIELYNIISDN